MIYTVTLNPSLDYIVGVGDFRPGMTNRTSYERIFAGGKGINVSYVLKQLGMESTALGFLAGFVGEEIKKQLTEAGIGSDFFMLSEGVSRINIKLQDVEGTEINAKGPDIPTDMVGKLRNRMNALKAGDVLILSGSIPPSVSSSIYMDIMTDLQGKGIAVVVDAAKDLLENTLACHPFLIKPNHHELGELFGVELAEREAVLPYARLLQKKGARNVLVSMAEQGAVLLDENGRVHEREAVKGKVKNPVGAGDSMVAGFIAGYLETGEYEYAFYKGLAAGSASAFSERFATRKEVEDLLKRMKGI